MKLKTSVAAILFAFSATGAWAGDTGQPEAKASQPDATGAQQSPGTADETLSWKFVNGQAAGSENQAGTEQAAGSENQAGTEQAGTNQAGAGQAGSDQTGSDQAGSDQAAMSDDQGESDQAASSEKQSGSDQTANSEEQSGGDQSAMGEKDGDQAANADNPAANLKDKVVVIIPKDWKGSISDLIAALEASPDAKDIVVVQGGEPQTGNSSGEDDYTAGAKPVTKQQ